MISGGLRTECSDEFPRTVAWPHQGRRNLVAMIRFVQAPSTEGVADDHRSRQLGSGL
jgi:hypothetical protein